MLSKMAAPDEEFFASLERNFTGIGCTMEAQTMVINSTQCDLFIGEYNKYMVSGVTFSFNNNCYSLKCQCFSSNRNQCRNKTSTQAHRQMMRGTPGGLKSLANEAACFRRCLGEKLLPINQSLRLLCL